MSEINGTVFLVFYTRAENEGELFLSAHADVKGAREAAYLDACDNGGTEWTWGDDQPLYQLLNGTPVTAEPSILTNWCLIRKTKGKTRYADVGHYAIVEVPLHTR